MGCMTPAVSPTCLSQEAAGFSNLARAAERIDLPVDEVTISVDEGIGETVLIDRGNWACLCRGYGVRKHDG